MHQIARWTPAVLLTSLWAPPVVVEVNPAFAVLAPSVELPHVTRGIAQVVVNGVHDHSDAALIPREMVTGVWM